MNGLIPEHLIDELTHFYTVPEKAAETSALARRVIETVSRRMEEQK